MELIDTLEGRCFECNAQYECSYEPRIDESSGLLSKECCQDLRRVESHILQQINHNFQVANADESVYTGGPGVALFFIKAAAMRGEPALLSKAASLLAPWREQVARDANEDPSLGCSLLCGQAGWLCVEALRLHVASDVAECLRVIRLYTTKAATVLSSVVDADEWLYGRAGYLHGCLILQHVCGTTTVPDEIINAVSQIIIENGVKCASQLKHVGPLMWTWQGNEFLGAAHGVMGILFMLLHVDLIMKDVRSRRLIVGTLDWVITQKSESGNWPAVRNTKSDYLIHFCHGAPGAVHLFCKAYEVLGDARYLREAEAAGNLVWKYGMLKKGPSLCHGFAGNGYVFLALFRACRDPLWLLRAHHYGRVMLKPEVTRLCRTPDNPFSLFEGLAGAACFLLDLRLAPMTSALPFFEVGWLQIKPSVALLTRAPSNEESQAETPKFAALTIIGNPSVGKTTMLNCAAQKILFDAGPRAGGAVTLEYTEKKDEDGRCYRNLPGLAEPDERGDRCKEITKGLKDTSNKDQQIVFMCRESQGAVLEEDRTTIKLVLDAIPTIRANYGIIINQCGEYVMREKDKPEWKKEFLATLMRGLPYASPYVRFVPRAQQLDGQFNAIVPLSEDLNHFLREVVPKVQLAEADVAEINPLSFEEMKKQLKEAAALSEEQQNQIAALNLHIDAEQARGVNQQRLANAQAKCNTRLAGAGILCIVAISLPAVCSVLKLLAFDVPMWKLKFYNGAEVDIRKWLAPYISVFALYRIVSTAGKLMKGLQPDNSKFQVLGRTFMIYQSYITQRMVWLAVQTGDGFADLASAKSIFLSRDYLVAICWTATTIVSIGVPWLYFRRRINFEMAVFYQLIFEDLWQLVLGVVQVVLQIRSGSLVPEIVLFSSFSATLSVIETIGNIGSILAQQRVSPERLLA